MKKKYIVLIMIFIIIIAVSYFYIFSKFELVEKVEDSPHDDLLVNPGNLTVAMDIPYKPMEYYNENNEIVGFDVDLAKMIAKKLGLRYRVKNVDWDSIFDVVKDQDVDVAISSITITSERKEDMLFSIPYINAGQVMLIRRGDDRINSLEDLSDKIIGVEMGTTNEDIALEYVEDSNVKRYPEYLEALEALRNGSVDVVINDYIVSSLTVQEDGAFDLVAPKPFHEEYYGVATNKNNEILMERIDEIIRELNRDGELQKMQDKWFQQDE